MGHFQGMRRPLGGFFGAFMPFAPQREDPLAGEIRHIRHMLEKIMHTLEETLAAVQAARTSGTSIEALLIGIKKQLDAALGGQLTPSQQMRVDAIFNEATGAKEEIDAAIKQVNEPSDTLVPSQTTVTSSLNPSAPGDAITLSGGVISHPDNTNTAAMTGSITFKDGDTVLGSAPIDSTGVAAIASTSFPGGNLSAGDHSITASYSGDAVYAASTSDPLVQTVAAAATT